MYDRYQNFTVKLLIIQRYIQRIKTEELAEYDLKASHVSCIYYLHKEEQLTATELSEICLEDKSYISHSLKYLEDNGYVVCNSNAKKRYNAPFRLTDKGNELGGIISDKINHVLAPAGDGITEEERSVLYHCLDKISANLDKICEKYNSDH